jgi:hypothetical protein
MATQMSYLVGGIGVAYGSGSSWSRSNLKLKFWVLFVCNPHGNKYEAIFKPALRHDEGSSGPRQNQGIENRESRYDLVVVSAAS